MGEWADIIQNGGAAALIAMVFIMLARMYFEHQEKMKIKKEEPAKLEAEANGQVKKLREALIEHERQRREEEERSLAAERGEAMFTALNKKLDDTVREMRSHEAREEASLAHLHRLEHMETMMKGMVASMRSMSARIEHADELISYIRENQFVEEEGNGDD